MAEPTPEAIATFEIGGGLGDDLVVDGEGDLGEGHGLARRILDGAEDGEGQAGVYALRALGHDAGDHGGEFVVGVAAGDFHLGGHVHPGGGGSVAAKDLRERFSRSVRAASRGDDGVGAAVARDAHRHGRTATERGPDGGLDLRVRGIRGELDKVGAGVAHLRGGEHRGEILERHGGGAAGYVVNLPIEA